MGYVDTIQVWQPAASVRHRPPVGACGQASVFAAGGGCVQGRPHNACYIPCHCFTIAAIWRLHLLSWPRGPMDKASAHGAGDCRFESYRGQCCGRAAFSSRRQASCDQVVGRTCNLVAAGDVSTAWIWLDPAARGRRPPHNNTVHVACPRALSKTMDTLACPRSKEQQPTQFTKTRTCPTEVVCPSAREELGWPHSPLNDRCLRSRHGCHGSHMPPSVCPSLLLLPPGLEPGSLG